MAKREPDYLPSQAEIRAECLEIQAGWTDKEGAKRVVNKTGDGVNIKPHCLMLAGAQVELGNGDNR